MITWASKQNVFPIIMIRFISSSTQPAKLISTLFTSHMIASIEFLNRRDTFWAIIDCKSCYIKLIKILLFCFCIHRIKGIFAIEPIVIGVSTLETNFLSTFTFQKFSKLIFRSNKMLTIWTGAPF